MAELCLKCFLELGIQTHTIDRSDLRLAPTVEGFVRVVTPEIKAGRKFACVECGAVLEDNDLAFIHEVGECPYCHTQVGALWMKG